MTTVTEAPVASADAGRDGPLVRRAIASPVGQLMLVADGVGLVAVLWPNERAGRVPLGPANVCASEILLRTQEQLDAYFAGTLHRFDVPLAPRGTVFQQQVWAALAAIPYGETRTYRDIAVAIDRPAACRAVGAANGRNPISIIVPCHRVIGSGGSLTGFAGGLETKRTLLALEGIGDARLL